MSDFRTRLRTVDRIPGPDLWAEATQRAATFSRAPSHRTWANPRVWRLGLALVALLILASIGIAVVGGLIRRPDLPREVDHSSGWVAYPRQLGGSSHSPSLLYLARPGEEHRLINASPDNPLRQVCPAFSPDGSQLAWAEYTYVPGSENYATASVVIVGIDEHGMPAGDEVRIRARTPDSYPCPQWSPDGGSIAFIEALSRLWTAQADGSNPISLGPLMPTFPLGGTYTFAWSPDSTSLAVVRGQSSTTDGGNELWLIPADGSDGSLIYTADGIRGVSWSPDGTRIAIGVDSSIQPTPEPDGSLAAAPEERAIVVVRADGTGSPRQVGEGRRPVWSPKGDRIAYLKAVDSPGRVFFDAVVVVDPDGSDEVQLDSVRDGDLPWSANLPLWSSDGRRIVYIGSTGEYGWGDSALISVAADGASDPEVFGGRWFQEYYWGLSWQPAKPS